MSEKRNCNGCTWENDCVHAYASRRLPKSEGGSGLCLMDKDEEDTARNRMIWVGLPNDIQAYHATMTEFEVLKTRFYKTALEELKKTGADHVLYGDKIYNEDGSIRIANLCIQALSDEEFNERVGSAAGKDIYVFAVHTDRPLL